MNRITSLALALATAGAMAAVAGAQQTVGGPPVSLGGVNSDSERVSFEGLLNAAYETLQSKRFHDNLRSLGTAYPDIYIHFLGGGTPADPRTAVTSTAHKLSDAIAATPPYRYVRSPVTLVGGIDDNTATAGWTGTPDQRGSMTVGRFHLARWQSLDAVERSCAVNTIAHEMSHLISSQTPTYMMHLTDSYAASLTTRDRNGKEIQPPHAVASYLVGAVAQCTWLQENGYSPAVDLKACVQIFGHRTFNGNRCQSFSGNREIRARNDLPAEDVLRD